MTQEPIGVVGAGPAGLTAAWQLEQLGMDLKVFEANDERVGGLARTEEYKAYRFDIGGHRFFSKSQEVRDLWREFLGDEDFLKRQRMSRIYYNGDFYRYPIDAKDALRKLGLWEAGRCGLSYLRASLQPKKNLASFEDWVVAHFGRRLFEIFFETYTEKVWGMKCSEISADWAAQRIKGLSLFAAVKQALFGQRGEVVKTLIEEFHYPRLGPGMLWEQLAADLQGKGVDVLLGTKVEEIHHENGRVSRLLARSGDELREFAVSGVVSSMPLRSLLTSLRPEPPTEVLSHALDLRYRDFLTVVLIIDKPDVFPDNWIYIHDPNVKVGRVQNYKNWSPEMVPDLTRTALGLEYFCTEGDDLWASSDQELLGNAEREMLAIGLLETSDRIIDGTVIRVKKAYPVYDEGYKRNVSVIQDYLSETLNNLQVCGRNGMHKYNNQDHAMMTGLMAARNLAGEHWDQWRVNQDAEYLEVVTDDDMGGRLVPERLTKLEG